MDKKRFLKQILFSQLCKGENSVEELGRFKDTAHWSMKLKGIDQNKWYTQAKDKRVWRKQQIMPKS